MTTVSMPSRMGMATPVMRMCLSLLLMIAHLSQSPQAQAQAQAQQAQAVVTKRHVAGPHQCAQAASDGDHLIIGVAFPDQAGEQALADEMSEYMHFKIGDPTMIAGLSRGLRGVCRSTVRELTIPPALGYFPDGPPAIQTADSDARTSVYGPSVPTEVRNTSMFSDLTVLVTVYAVTSPEDFVIFDAMKSRNATRVLEMIESGIGIDAVDERGDTPLIHSVRDNAMVMFSSLLNSRRPRVNVNYAKPTGHTAVFFALQHKDSIALKALLKRGADANVALVSPPNRGATPLHFACRLGRVKHAGLLLDFGANPLAATAAGELPLDFAPSTLDDSARYALEELFADAINRAQAESETADGDAGVLLSSSGGDEL